MSDGVANVDATNPFAILESASDNNPNNPLRLITIGVGITNYNDVLLEQLAQHGNGWYRYLSEPEEGRRLFDRENWLALSVPFADQTRAQVVWNDELINSWRMIGYENRVTSDESFTRAEKKFAELPGRFSNHGLLRTRTRRSVRPWKHKRSHSAMSKCGGSPPARAREIANTKRSMPSFQTVKQKPTSAPSSRSPQIAIAAYTNTAANAQGRYIKTCPTSPTSCETSVRQSQDPARTKTSNSC